MMTDSIFHNYPDADGECREAYAQIFVMDTDGGNKMRIASDVDLNCNYNSNLKWSPDSKNILFETSIISPGSSIANVDIWIIGVDGSNKRQLTRYQEYDSDPAWSPDGTKIAYRSGNLSYFDIWTMNPDGGDKKQLTTGALITDFDWSPDGRRIAYVSWLTKEPKATEIWIMDADGSNKELLLSVPYDHYLVGDLAWNPNGSKIAFDMMDVVNGLNSDIYVIEVQNGK